MKLPHENSRLDVSVVIPAHNEEGNIGPLMDQFGELSRKCRFNFEVVLVDDGSTDRTLDRVSDAQKNHRFIRLVTLPYRRGLTEALRAGFAVAKGEIIVFYPADRQFHPNDIPKMVEKVRAGYDLVTGRKIGEYDKKVVSGIYNRLSRMLFPSIPVTDLNSVKAFRREMTDVFDYRHDWHRFWVAIVCEAGYRVGEVDVTLYKRRVGKSKFGFWRIPGGMLDLLAVKFQYHTMRRPLWYFGMTGSILLALAFGLGVYAVYDRLANTHGYRPLLYLVMTLGISGVVFFTLGLLAESVAGIREQLQSLRGTPRYGVHHVPPAGRTSERTPPARRSSESSPTRGRESTRPSSDSRRRRPDSEDRRTRQSNRSPSRSRRLPKPNANEGKSESSIRRRALDAESAKSSTPAPTPVPTPVPTPAPTPKDVPTTDQQDRDLPANDLFSDAKTAMSDRSPDEDDRGASSSPVTEQANQPNVSTPATPKPRPFGRRNRR
jgi:glycosyltransferase involved in cell wall biosynthesis